MPRARASSDSEASEPRAKSKKGAKKRGRPSQASRAAASDEEESDGEEVDTGSKKKSKSKAAPKLSGAELHEKANEVARLALCTEFRRTALKRDEINKKVLEGNTRSFNAALAEAQEILRDGLGMELVEARTKGTGFGVSTIRTKSKKKTNADEEESDDAAPTKAKFVPSKTYVLRSTLDPKMIAAAADVVGSVMWEEAETPPEATSAKNKTWAMDDGVLINWKKSDQLQHLGILQVILSLILVSGRALADNQLRSYLKKLDLKGSINGSSTANNIPMNPSTAPSTAITKLNMEALLGTFIKQGYLEKQPNGLGAANKNRATQEDVGDGGDPTLEWRWGPRADVEMGELNMAKFIENFYAEPEGTEREVIKTKSALLHKNLERAAGAALQPAQKAA